MADLETGPFFGESATAWVNEACEEKVLLVQQFTLEADHDGDGFVNRTGIRRLAIEQGIDPALLHEADTGSVMKVSGGEERPILAAPHTFLPNRSVGPHYFVTTACTSLRIVSLTRSCLCKGAAVAAGPGGRGADGKGTEDGYRGQSDQALRGNLRPGPPA